MRIAPERPALLALLLAISLCFPVAGWSAPLATPAPGLDIHRIHPGHYLSLNTACGSDVSTYLQRNPAIQGVVIEYPWAALEAAAGQFDFSHIDDDLLCTQQTGKQLIVKLIWHSPGNTPFHLPNWLKSSAYNGGYYSYTLANGSSGTAPKLWHLHVNKRLANLIRKVGRHVDRLDGIEAVVLDDVNPIESFSDLSQRYTTPLNQHTYLLAVDKLHAIVANAMPHTVVLQALSMGGEQLALIKPALLPRIAAHQIGILQDNTPIDNLADAALSALSGTVPLGLSVSKYPQTLQAEPADLSMIGPQSQQAMDIHYLVWDGRNREIRADLSGAGAISPPLPTSALSTNQDVGYCQVDGVELLMDISRPRYLAAGKRLPVILFAHGGAWRSGGRGEFTSLQEDFAKHGYVTATYEYRLTSDPSQQFPMPTDPQFQLQADGIDMLKDTKCAIQYLKAHSRDYAINPKRMALWGISAGGTLALQAGLSGADTTFNQGLGFTSGDLSVKAVINMHGATDLLDLHDFWSESGAQENIDGILTPYAGCPANEAIASTTCLDSYQKLSVINPIPSGLPVPAVLTLHGEQDMAIPLRQAVQLHDSLLAAGGRSELYPYPHLGHGFSQRVTAGIISGKTTSQRYAATFLDRELWGLDAPDSDADGVYDYLDDLPLDASGSVDQDGDGYPDAWNPGHDPSPSSAEWFLGLDFFPVDPSLH